MPESKPKNSKLNTQNGFPHPPPTHPTHLSHSSTPIPMKLSEEIEIDSPPIFDLNNRVRVTKLLRNDGTFPGQEVGARLAEPGDIGYVIGIGTYLQRAYIYSVHFLENNRVIGCLGRELELAEDLPLPVDEDDW
jgi:nitrogen fixation protein NifZ